ncbi:MAG TPA: cbb3-type cytochrome c oxidase subunit I [Hanamia sp.]|nr:cbb3-type cytochrome c oxidase subunit I [Hanamia sp.]
MILQFYKKAGFTLIFSFLAPAILFAQSDSTISEPGGRGVGALTLMILLLVITFIAAIYLALKTSKLLGMKKKANTPGKEDLQQIINKLDSNEIDTYLNYKQMKKQNNKSDNTNSPLIALFFMIVSVLYSSSVFAQATPKGGSIFNDGGIIITLILILTPILVGIILMIIKVRNLSRKLQLKRNQAEAERVSNYLKSLPEEEITEALKKRKEVLDYRISKNALSGELQPEDKRGIIRNVDEHANIRFIEEKRKAIERPQVDAGLSKLVIWFLVCATVWLVVFTSVGEYLGIKFVAPDADHLSWLSFGRLRPVHTNGVFWGWSSMAMLGLAYYVIPRVGNNKLYSLKLGWWSLWLINSCVFLGSIALMAGINNSGGEYREYIWPIMLLFALGIILSLINFLKTVAIRKTKEIYVSNWYIIAALMFVTVVALVGYLPFWQNGLGETIAQGFYMHQAVGMWFMMLTLGLVYYYLPQQLNKPIYSYGLGILAFWSQILFYTIIGMHHFVFSPIPWPLQTVAIVGSMGMIIPVVAGTTNFLMTFKGSWNKLSGSYSLPFFLIGTIFYFTGSLQGTAEAFRSTNLYWHFTDFTVAHSHMTMYGIIAFFMWGGIYAIIPRLTRKEPPQLTVGIHFWMSFIGLLFYTIPLMIGGTLRGIAWMNNVPFIDTVSMMAPYWLWRAIGGTLMWTAHLFFAYNMYKMIRPSKTIDINAEAISKITTDAEIVKVH